MAKRMQRINFTLTEIHDFKLDHIQEYTKLAKSDIVRRMIDEYYEKFLEKNKLESRSFDNV